MRSPVKSAISVVTLGVLGASWYAGQSAVATNSGQFAAPEPIESNSPNPEPSQSSSSNTNAGQNSGNNNGSNSGSNNGSNSNSGSTTKPSSGSTTKPSAAPSSAPSQTTPAEPPAAKEVSKDGDVIESGFGTVQVRVTKLNGKITAVDMLRANATHGRASAFSYLVQYAIQSNGASFGNISGATFTTNAFKASLRSALAKF